MSLENVAEIETSLGLEEGTLKEAIASEDAVKIDIPAGKFFDTEKHVIKTTEDHEAFVNNIKTESKTAGIEIAVKDARKELGYNFEGKTISNLLTAHGEKILEEAKVEPDKKVKELSDDLTALKGVNDGLTIELNTIKSETAVKDNQRKIQGNILESITGDLTLSKGQLLTLFLADYQVVDEDGKTLIKKGGETLKNENTRDPLTLADVMPDFLKPFAKKVEGGGAGGDSNNDDKAGSMAAFIKEMEGKNHSVGSEDFNQEMGKRIAAKTLEG